MTIKNMPLLTKLIWSALATVIAFTVFYFTIADAFFGLMFIVYSLPLMLLIFASLILGDFILSKNKGSKKTK